MMSPCSLNLELEDATPAQTRLAPTDAINFQADVHLAHVMTPSMPSDSYVPPQYSIARISTHYI